MASEFKLRSADRYWYVKLGFVDWFLKVNVQIFTNSDRIHAIKALDRLGIKDCFEQIICFETMNFNLSKATRPEEIPVILKPSMEAMNIAIEAAQVDPCRTVWSILCFSC